jgi:hypothetical protein
VDDVKCPPHANESLEHSRIPLRPYPAAASATSTRAWAQPMASPSNGTIRDLTDVWSNTLMGLTTINLIYGYVCWVKNGRSAEVKEASEAGPTAAE